MYIIQYSWKTATVLVTPYLQASVKSSYWISCQPTHSLCNAWQSQQWYSWPQSLYFNPVSTILSALVLYRKEKRTVALIPVMCLKVRLEQFHSMLNFLSAQHERLRCWWVFRLIKELTDVLMLNPCLTLSWTELRICWLLCLVPSCAAIRFPAGFNLKNSVQHSSTIILFLHATSVLLDLQLRWEQKWDEVNLDEVNLGTATANHDVAYIAGWASHLYSGLILEMHISCEAVMSQAYLLHWCTLWQSWQLDWTGELKEQMTAADAYQLSRLPEEIRARTSAILIRFCLFLLQSPLHDGSVDEQQQLSFNLWVLLLGLSEASVCLPQDPERVEAPSPAHEVNVLYVYLKKRWRQHCGRETA